MKAARRIASETTTAGIACDARGQGQTFCQLERGEVARIDKLAGQVRLALPSAETSESFTREVFAALLPRGKGPT